MEIKSHKSTNFLCGCHRELIIVVVDLGYCRRLPLCAPCYKELKRLFSPNRKSLRAAMADAFKKGKKEDV